MLTLKKIAIIKIVTEAKKNNHLENSMSPTSVRTFFPIIKTPAIATEQPTASKFPKTRDSSTLSPGDIITKKLPASAKNKPKNEKKEGREFSQKNK